MKAKLIIAIAALAVVAAAAAGGAMWYTSTTAGAAVAAKPAPETKLTKYVTLDTHYLSVDLVLATTAADEKATKEQLPLLRSIAVSALSARTMAEASAMTVDQYAAELNKVFNANYAKENHIKPFSEVMVGKLIIE